jgi:hypothetical protein
VSRLVVAVEGEVTMRAAQSLVVHPGVDEVSLLAPAKSVHFPTVSSPAGCDLVIGSEKAAGAGKKHGIPVAVTGTLDDQAGVFLGSPVGLALALAVGMDMVETIALALPGEASGDTTVVFPSPIDARSAIVEHYDGHAIQVARGQGTLAAVMVMGSARHRVVLDDNSFLTGIALAAAAVVGLDSELGTAIPAWSRSVEYLQAAVSMGLVIGERSTAA